MSDFYSVLEVIQQGYITKYSMLFSSHHLNSLAYKAIHAYHVLFDNNVSLHYYRCFYFKTSCAIRVYIIHFFSSHLTWEISKPISFCLIRCSVELFKTNHFNTDITHFKNYSAKVCQYWKAKGKVEPIPPTRPLFAAAHTNSKSCFRIHGIVFTFLMVDSSGMAINWGIHYVCAGLRRFLH